MQSIQVKGQKKVMGLKDMLNRYLCELKSLKDSNSLPLILIEQGFTPLTSTLLG
jgi:hypothetical protein